MPRELLAIGVGDYDQDSVFRRLPKAASDVALMAACFGNSLPEESRFHSQIMINPRADEATEAIEEILEKLDANSVFILYFAGHAIQERGNKRQWLLCKNALACFANGNVGTGAISSEYFNDSLARRGKGKIFSIIDACREDPTYDKGLSVELTGMDQFGNVEQTDRTVSHKRTESQEDDAEYQSEMFTLYACQPGKRARDGVLAGALSDVVLDRVRKGAEVRLDDALFADLTKLVQEFNPDQKPCKRTTTTEFVLVPGARRPTEERASAGGTKPSRLERHSQAPRPEQSAQEVTSSAHAALHTERYEAALGSSGATKWSDSLGRQAGTRQTLKIGSEEYGFCLIRAGEFVMGSPSSEKCREEDEVIHHVKLTKDFWMLETPVTQSLYEEVIGCNLSRFYGDNLPVENVSWDEAMKFCTELTNRLPDGLRASLPTEAQWEYACRAGTRTAYWYGNSSDKSKMNCARLFSSGKTTPVKKYAPNPWGLYDMHGNVYEWVLDYYEAYPRSKVVDPKGPDTASGRVTRGGSWFLNARYCRSACRGWVTPDSRHGSLGFRFLLSCD